jgi:nitrogen regulatory protein PII
MQFKLIIALVDDDKSEEVLRAARQAGATGATVIGNARGEGLREQKTFLGLDLARQREVLFFLVEKRLSRRILETIEQIGEFDSTPGTGIAFQLAVEDAVGVAHQVRHLLDEHEGAAQ